LRINLKVVNIPIERTLLKREYKGEITINIVDIFRNPDIQDSVIKEVKKIKRGNNNI
jgi:hypothetical protein